MAAIRFLTTLARSVHSGLFQDDAVLQQACPPCPSPPAPSTCSTCLAQCYRMGRRHPSNRHLQLKTITHLLLPLPKRRVCDDTMVPDAVWLLPIAANFALQLPSHL